MKVSEIITESVVQVWSRTKGGKMVRKYRCTAGPRKSRIVASPGVCTQPKKLGSVYAIKKARARRSPIMKIKTARSKRAGGASQRLARLNISRRGRIKSRRSHSGSSKSRGAIKKIASPVKKKNTIKRNK
jgi:hypothetical protein